MGRYGPRNSDVKGTGVRPGRTTPTASPFRRSEQEKRRRLVRACVHVAGIAKKEPAASHLDAS
jgi:hypothetical protein